MEPILEASVRSSHRKKVSNVGRMVYKNLRGYAKREDIKKKYVGPFLERGWSIEKEP